MQCLTLQCTQIDLASGKLCMHAPWQADRVNGGGRQVGRGTSQFAAFIRSFISYASHLGGSIQVQVD